jgi:spore coat protein H
MSIRRDWRRATGRQRLEVAAIILFTVASGVYLLVNQLRAGPTVVAAQESPEVTAQANAMPNQGWAPLMVYFSAFGSRSEGASIVRYEWDLDGNGSFDYDATNEGGYANYLYSKPGEYVISLRVTDSQGRFATDQTTISVRLRASSSVDYWTVFDDSRVRRIDLSLTQADWDLMWVDPMSKTMVQADVVIFGETLNDVGLRMRGQFSLNNSGDKKPWKIDTNAYVDGQEFHNLHQLMLLNSIGDASMMNEKLAYEMMEFAGLSASHTAYVELWIDLTDDDQAPIFWGVYLMVERVDKKYLSNRFGPESTDGNLYKASHAQRGPMDLIYYGDSIEAYPTQNGQYAYGKMNNEEEADYSDIVELCRVIDGTTYASDEEFMQALEEVLNVDAFLRYIAVVTTIDNWDTYPYTGNNYYLFDNPVTGRFEWIPWDLTWGGNPQTALFGRADPGLLERAPLYDNVFQVEEYKSKYAAYVDLLLRYWFNTANISDKAQTYHRMIAPYVTQSTGDKAFYGEQPMWAPESFADSWQGLVQFTTARHSYLESQLQQYWP